MRKDSADDGRLRFFAERVVVATGARAANDPAVERTRRELAAEVLRRFGKVRLRLTGASMLPTMFPGDVATIERCVLKDVAAGEIVLYQRGGQLCSHRAAGRVVRDGENLLRVRGDAMSWEDAPVSEQEFLGRVTSVERGERIMAPPGLTVMRSIVARALQRSHWAVRLVLAAQTRL